MDSSGWHPVADPATMAAWARRRQIPDNELPVPAALPAVLYHDDAVGVGLSGSVHTTGLALSVALRLRHPPPRSSPPLRGFLGDAPDTPADQRFLFGVQLADGRAVQPQDRPMPGGPPPQPSTADHLLFRTGGQGGSSSFTMRYWLTPLPPPGPTLLVLRCPAIGLPETTVGFDATPLHDAARRVTVLWPPIEPHRPVPELRRPEPPSDGWFAVRP